MENFLIIPSNISLGMLTAIRELMLLAVALATARLTRQSIAMLRYSETVCLPAHFFFGPAGNIINITNSAHGGKRERKAV